MCLKKVPTPSRKWTVVDKYTVIDDVLVVGAIGKESAGSTAAYNRGDSAMQCVRECGESRWMPFFSIVMPTRNRANLLKYALRSALQQTFQDYEVVVSDNQSEIDYMRNCGSVEKIS